MSWEIECSFKTMLENVLRNRMFIQDYAGLRRWRMSWFRKPKHAIVFVDGDNVKCSLKTMPGFVDDDVLICKGRLTDLENVPFLKLILIILTVYLGRWRVAAEGVLSLVSCLSLRSFCRLVTVRSKSWERIKYSDYIFNIEAWVHTPSQLNTLQRLNRLQTLLV